MSNIHFGYKKRFLNPILKRHECPICLHVMRDPVQTECGHLFCRGCLEPVLINTSRSVCPICKIAISTEQVFPDNACRREILSLEVYCDASTNGCLWTGALRLIEVHLAECKYRDMLCRQCGHHFPLFSMVTHQERECPMRPGVCQYCKKEVPVTQLEAHIQKVCPEYPHPCPNGCKQDILMKLPDLEAHLDPRSGDCPLAEVPCPFKPYGCIFVTQRQYLSTHLDLNSIKHIHMQADCWMELKDQANRSTRDIEHMGEQISLLEGHMTSVEGLLNALGQRIETLDGRPSKLATPPETTLIQEQIGHLQRTIEGLQRQVGSNIMGSMATVEMPSHKITAVKDVNIDTLHTKVAELDHGLDRCLSSCLDQELRLQLLERATYNGVLLWKIDDFERRRKEAVDGVTMSLYSIPFYTSRHGYKMCARVYLNGDGMGKGTHLSLFFVVMKGPFDALLSWPFKQKVTMTIINQAGKKHVTDTFRPDPQSNSFQRPTLKEMNVASGCPMFIRLEHLLNGGFVKDDCIFLRVVVETNDLSGLNL